MTIGPISARPLEWNPPKAAVSRVPYLPGLDGMRALAVVAVMVYHANNEWLPGGFIGVEVFFVISGYLITLLLIGEHERTGRINLKEFWLRRARRLLPALFVMMALLMTYTALFKRDRLGQLRGDALGGLGYISNWYQIWIGQGYTSRLDWVPLRHLWSLAVEEQFYLAWPLVMVALIGLGRRRLPQVAGWLAGAAVVVALAMALLYHSGRVGTPATTPGAFWRGAGRSINKNDTLYLSTITRSTGLLLGAAFAMLWRPFAVVRGPLRNKGRQLDLVAGIGLGVLVVLALSLHVVTVTGEGDARLFRGGFLLVGVCTVAVMAAVTHRRAAAGPLLGHPMLNWVGTRSYGLYLYHWPIYQIVRKPSGEGLTLFTFAGCMLVTGIITELSYHFVETPVRKRQVGAWWRGLQNSTDTPARRVIGAAALVVTVVVGFSAASMATAALKQNDVQSSLDTGADSAGDLDDLLNAATTTGAHATTTSAPAGVATVPDSSGNAAVATSSSSSSTGPSTTMPAGGVRAFGDSVMLGAAPVLEQHGISVTAQEGIQIYDVTPVVRQLAADGQLSPTVVVQLGTNGPFEFNHLKNFAEALSGVPNVYILTIRLGTAVPWAGANNEAIRALPAQFPNVHVIDWAVESDACPGDCFYIDGVGHLKPDGMEYYAQMIEDAVTA